MIKKNLVSVLVVFFLATTINAQTFKNDSLLKPKVNLGLGLGIDYGGLGIRLSYSPIKYVAAFGALGYNFVGAGYNAGLCFKSLPNKRVCPYLVGMYGYNAFIFITGTNQYNKVYYGPSFGFGTEIWNRKRSNFFNLEFLYPFRSDEYDKDVNALKSNPTIDLKNTPPDFAFSIGFHFGLNLKDMGEGFKNLPRD